jgi:DNA polymerase III delta prime subunit
MRMRETALPTSGHFGGSILPLGNQETLYRFFVFATLASLVTIVPVSRTLARTLNMVSSAEAAPFPLRTAPSTNTPTTESVFDCSKILNGEFDPTAAVVLDHHRPNSQVTEMVAALSRDVIGQDRPVEALANALEISLAQLEDPNLPVGRYLFAGPTGVGKTQLAKALVKHLGGDPNTHLIRIDAGEYQSGSEISKLIGASATYVGYGDKPKLHPDNLKKAEIKIRLPNGKEKNVFVVLVDEIEKAADQVFKLLLGILDSGRLTLGDNTEVKFSNAIVIATSNLGATEVNALIDAKREALNQTTSEIVTREEADLTGRHDEDLRQAIDLTYRQTFEKRYPPEFLNRWQEIIRFYHLSHPEFMEITHKELAELQRHIYERVDTKFGLVVSGSARERFVLKGTDFKNGARELKRTMERFLRNRLARLLVTGQVKEGDIIHVDINGAEDFVFRRVATGLDRVTLARFGEEAYPGHNLAQVQFDKIDEDSADPNQDGENGVSKQNYVSALQTDTRALKKLWISLKGPEPKQVTKRIMSNQTAEFIVRYLYMDELLLEVEMSTLSGNLKVSVKAGIPNALKDHFREEALDHLKSEDIQKLLEAK